MQISRLFFSVACLFATLLSAAQDRATIQQYIDTYKDLAMAEMQRTGVPAAIKLAQGIHETTAGTSVLVRKSNNHFGIKCKANWTGESVSHTDDAPNECFRKYPEASQSYRDHSDFLKGSSRYASLFEFDPLDYSAWAYGLKKAGYATNPRYPQVIIKLIEEYHLQDYTLIAMGKMQPQEEAIAQLPAPKELPEETLVTAGKQEAAEEVKTYPAGEFKINDTRVVFAEKGSSLLALAQQYQIPLKRIFEFNEMEETESLAEARLIYLQRKRKTGANEFHFVKEGETLEEIATEQAIRLESLLEYNHLETDMQPAPGEQLYLRQKAPAMPKLLRRDLARHSTGSSETIQ